jgi:hypothetical protein
MEEVYVPSTLKRLLAFSVDQTFLLFFYLPFYKIFWQLFASDGEVIISLNVLFLLFLIPAIYEFIFLVLFQATPGKLLFNLKVVPSRDSSSALSLSSCVLRPLVGRFTLFFSWAVYAVAFFRFDRTHVADWVAETRVVQFSPRWSRPKRRLFLASFLVIFHFYDGLSSSFRIFKSIDWKNRKVDFRSVVEKSDVFGEVNSSDVDSDDDDEDFED